MKMSKREKIMLLILGVILVFGGGYYFIVEPQFTKISELNIKKEEYVQLVETVQFEISSVEKIDTRYEELYLETEELTRRFFPKIFQDRIIVMLDTLINETQKGTGSMGFSGISIKTVDMAKQETKESYILYDIAESFNIINSEDGMVEKPSDTTAKEQVILLNPIEVMSVTLQYDSSFENLMAFIRAVEGLDRTIQIGNLAASMAEDALSGSILLNFYAVPKIHLQDEEYLEWPYENTYGRENPFEEFRGYIAP